ncbi:imidazolonepropionase [uncultured Jatrophihabitans sp.]|uniref:imidazolonepropionase n=1 Tax=uncultured Jatrophihabitans sp. TaxID=1610747 RepID=UPI0035CA0974
MATTLITDIAELVTNDPAQGDGSPLGVVHDAAVVADDTAVRWVGRAADAPAADRVVHATGRAVIPGFVDAHTHLLFAGDRSAEFAARMAGDAYDGGGIASTVTATRAASEDDLRTLLARRVYELRSQGTTTIEIKSGYGLDVVTERRLLELAGTATEETTFLGGHVVPPGVDRDDYVRLVAGEMLVACAPFARWIDVFCEPASAHAFDGDESRTILQAGAAAGLEVRVHGNQLAAGPGVQLAVELDAASVDHCTYLTGADVDALAGSGTVATLLPGVEFSTRSPYPDARRLLDAGVTVAVATDCNPGTSYTSSMSFVIALAVREMRMTAAEALWSATAGGARSLRRSDIGRIAVGGRPHLTMLDAPSHAHLAYRPGVPLTRPIELAERG